RRSQVGPVTKSTVWLLWLFLLGCALAMGQNSYTVSGTITDKSNGETLIGASVLLAGTSIGGITNEYGFYSITAPAGEYTLRITYMGYNEVQMKINLVQDLKNDVEVSEFSTELDEVVVTADEPERALLGKPEMS